MYQFKVGDTVFWLDPRAIRCLSVAITDLREEGRIAQICKRDGKRRHVDVKWLYPKDKPRDALDAFSALLKRRYAEKESKR